jgi:hypothetical protein
MPDGAPFKHDLFISYASADNWDPSQVPWVARLHEELTRLLRRRLARRPSICFFDSNDPQFDADGRQLFATPDEIRGCAAFLAVLSPGYLTTERTIAELDAFCREGAADRVVLLELLPVGPIEKMPYLRRLQRTKFWRKDGESAEALTPELEPKEYVGQLEQLADLIADAIGDHRPAPTETSATRAEAAPTAPPPAAAAAPAYARSSAEYWLHRVSKERALAPASEPIVLVSYASEDQSWVDEMNKYLAPGAETLKDPDGRIYQLWSYADARRGTTLGDEFPEVVADKMWSCRAAVLVFSDNYFQSRYCKQIELPFLLWRREHHKLLCMPVRIGKLPVDKIRLPEYEGRSRTVNFDDLIDDRQAALDFASSEHRDLSLLQLRERNILYERQDRYKGLAVRIADHLRQHHAALEND